MSLLSKHLAVTTTRVLARVTHKYFPNVLNIFQGLFQIRIRVVGDNKTGVPARRDQPMS